MSVDLIASASKAASIAGASGSLQIPLNVPNVPGRVALVSVYWFGEPDCTGATFSAAYGTDTVNLMQSIAWGSNDRLTLFGISAPKDGQGNLVVSFANMPTGGLRCMGVEVLVYGGVEAIDTPVLSTPATNVNNTVSVASVQPAWKTVFAHASRKKFTAYNQTKRADLPMSAADGILWWYHSISGELLMGEAPGAATVTSTATQASTALWGAVGVNLSPAPVNFAMETIVPPAETAVAFSVYRVQETEPKRTWKIPGSSRGAATTTWNHKAGSVLDYTFDFTDVMTGDDELVNVTFRASSVNADVLSVNFTGTTGTFWVGGMEVGRTYTITGHAVSDGGREYEYSATLKCVA